MRGVNIFDLSNVRIMELLLIKMGRIEGKKIGIGGEIHCFLLMLRFKLLVIHPSGSVESAAGGKPGSG